MFTFITFSPVSLLSDYLVIWYKTLVLDATQDNHFLFCHWNLNSISAHNNLKISLLRAFISLYNFDVVYISKTYLDSTTALYDENLEITGYNMLRADHASNSKKWS